MSDKPSDKGIPAWQLPSNDKNTENKQESTAKNTSSPSESPSQHSTAQQNPANTESPSDTTMEQAKRFLSDESLKDAPLEQKIAFLQSKGLSSTDIDQAIQEAGIASAATDSFTSQASQVMATNPQSHRDIPPIITYPEFLLQAQKPPPLITISRLLNVAYAAAGAGAALYGLSKYLVGPMTESLASARHDFAMHVQSQVDQLNEKLREVVSIDVQPQSGARRDLPFKTSSTTVAGYAASDADSTNSDPTELFHRDFGTQTSPIETAASSSSSSSDALPDTPANPTEDQTNSLSKLSNQLTAIINEDTLAGSANAEISTVIKVLDEYLDSLAYSYGSNNAFNYGYGKDSGKNWDKQNDEVSKIKAEIRSVKGVLLSARNFPGSSTARTPLYPPNTNNSTTNSSTMPTS